MEMIMTTEVTQQLLEQRFARQTRRVLAQLEDLADAIRKFSDDDDLGAIEDAAHAAVFELRQALDGYDQLVRAEPEGIHQ